MDKAQSRIKACNKAVTEKFENPCGFFGGFSYVTAL